jgi:hypothetical protein
MAVILQQLEQETIRKLENDTTATSDIDRWLRDSLIEIAGNPDYRDSFPELEEFGPVFNLTGGPIGTTVQEYPESNLVPVGDFLIKTLDILIWIDYPTNTKTRQLDPTNFQDTDKYQSFPSLPTQWYRFGNNIGFEPPPNQNYQVQARLMRRHPITDYFNTNGQLNQTVILLPNEWFEVLEWAAAMRGYMEKLNYERANEIKQMLWGDPAHPNDNPGLIASVKTKRRSEAWLVQQPLRPVIKTSCWGV